MAVIARGRGGIAASIAIGGGSTPGANVGSTVLVVPFDANTLAAAGRTAAGPAAGTAIAGLGPLGLGLQSLQVALLFTEGAPLDLDVANTILKITDGATVVNHVLIGAAAINVWGPVWRYQYRFTDPNPANRIASVQVVANATAGVRYAAQLLATRVA